MANPEVWSSVQVHVESARAPAKTLTAITNASPGVATSEAHGFVDGDCVLLTVVGMQRVDRRVVRVSGKTDDTFNLEGVDTTDLGTFVSGTAEKITFGIAASTFTDVSPSGGESKEVTSSTIHDPQDYDVPIGYSSLKYGFTSQWKPEDPALVALAKFFNTGTDACVRLTFKSGRKLQFNGNPSVSMAAGGSAGNFVTTPVNISVRGPLTTYAA